MHYSGLWRRTLGAYICHSHCSYVLPTSLICRTGTRKQANKSMQNWENLKLLIINLKCYQVDIELVLSPLFIPLKIHFYESINEPVCPLVMVLRWFHWRWGWTFFVCHPFMKSVTTGSLPVLMYNVVDNAYLHVCSAPNGHLLSCRYLRSSVTPLAAVVIVLLLTGY